jgi:hypothetical protein
LGNRLSGIICHSSSPHQKTSWPPPKKDYDDATQAAGAGHAECKSMISLFGSTQKCYEAGRDVERRKQKWVEAQADLANLELANTLDGKIKTLDGEIQALTDKINHTRPVPEHKDATASRIAKETGWSEEKISSRRPIILAGIAELSALCGSIVLDLAFAYLVAWLLGRVSSLVAGPRGCRQNWQRRMSGKDP